MKSCLCCGGACESDAPHCPACGEASFGDVIEPQPKPDASAESSAGKPAQSAPNNQPRRAERQGAR